MSIKFLKEAFWGEVANFSVTTTTQSMHWPLNLKWEICQSVVLRYMT